MAHDVFLSYSRADESKARELKSVLEGMGLSVFFDQLRLRTGESFPEVLADEIRACKVVVALWSKHALSRPWVRKECSLALDLGKLLPVAAETLNLAEDAPLQFYQIHYADFSRIYAGHEHPEAVDYLASEVSRHMGRQIMASSNNFSFAGPESVPPVVEPETHQETGVSSEPSQEEDEQQDVRPGGMTFPVVQFFVYVPILFALMTLFNMSFPHEIDTSVTDPGTHQLMRMIVPMVIVLSVMIISLLVTRMIVKTHGDRPVVFLLFVLGYGLAAELLGYFMVSPKLAGERGLGDILLVLASSALSIAMIGGIYLAIRFTALRR